MVSDKSLDSPEPSFLIKTNQNKKTQTKNKQKKQTTTNKIREEKGIMRKER